MVEGLLRAAEMAREMSEQLQCSAAAFISRGDYSSAHVATMVSQAYVGFAARCEAEAEREPTGTYAFVVDRWVPA